jgi:hypothetical protein
MMTDVNMPGTLPGGMIVYKNDSSNIIYLKHYWKTYFESIEASTCFTKILQLLLETVQSTPFRWMTGLRFYRTWISKQ